MTKPTFKLQLSPTLKADGTACVYLRITHNRKKKYISTGVYLKPEFWNPKQQTVRSKVKNYRNLTLFFEQWKQKAQDAIIKLQSSEMDISLENYETLILQTEKSEDLIPFIQEELNRNKGKWSAETVRNHKSKLEVLKRFRGTINMHKIDYLFLEDYQTFLEEGRNYNTAHSHLRFFRMMINRAISQGLTENYPFKGYKMPEPESKDKDFLDKTERNRLFELLDGGNLPGYLHKTLHIFLLACYTGIRNGDWHQFVLKEVESDMLIIRQSKKKGTVVRIPLTSTSKKLLETLPVFYKPLTNKQYNQNLKEIMQLAGIQKHISTHCARHTFVIMCINEAKIPAEIVAKYVDDKLTTLQQHYARYLDSYKKEEIMKLEGL